MKKLLPLTLIMAGFMAACNANLTGSVFNKKMMAYNFGEEYSMTDYEQKVEQKAAITFPDGESYSSAIKLTNNNFYKVISSGAKIAVYSAQNGALVVPFGAYADSDFIYYNKKANNVGYVGVKRVENEVHYIDVYDDFGTKILTAEGSDFTVSNYKQYKFYDRPAKSNALFVNIVKAGDVIKLVTYNLDYTSKVEDYVNPEFVNDITPTGDTNMAKYGRKDIDVRKLDSSGRRRGAYNKKTHKFISSFELYTTSESFYLGDYVFATYKHEVDPKSDDYHYFTSNRKYKQEVFKINYMTGKKTDLKVNYLIKSLGDVYSKNGIVEYQEAEIQYITKNKGLDSSKYQVILDRNLKVVADVDGMDMWEIVKMGDYYFNDVTCTSFNDKGEELQTFYNYHTSDKEMGIISYTAENGDIGVCDLAGREILPAKYTQVQFRMGSSALAKDADNTYLIKFEKAKGKYTAKVALTFPISEYNISQIHGNMNKANFYATKGEEKYLVDVKAGTASLVAQEERTVILSPEYFNMYGTNSTIAGLYRYGETYNFVISSIRKVNQFNY